MYWRRWEQPIRIHLSSPGIAPLMEMIQPLLPHHRFPTTSMHWCRVVLLEAIRNPHRVMMLMEVMVGSAHWEPWFRCWVWKPTCKLLILISFGRVSLDNTIGAWLYWDHCHISKRSEFYPVRQSPFTALCSPRIRREKLKPTVSFLTASLARDPFDGSFTFHPSTRSSEWDVEMCFPDGIWQLKLHGMASWINLLSLSLSRELRFDHTNILIDIECRLVVLDDAVKKQERLKFPAFSLSFSLRARSDHDRQWRRRRRSPFLCNDDHHWRKCAERPRCCFYHNASLRLLLLFICHSCQPPHLSTVIFPSSSKKTIRLDVRYRG